MKNKYFTTEPPLDEPEIINYTGDSMRRDGKQADESENYLLQQTFHLNQQSQDDNNDH